MRLRFHILSSLAILVTLGPAPDVGAQPQSVPEFAASDMLTGAPIRLADSREKVILLDFWASWCAPCLLSLPAYERIHNDLDPDRFELIAINVDEDTNDGHDFLLEHPVSYSVLADPQGVIGIPMKVRSLPVSYLIDREGRIVETFSGFREGDEETIQRKIQELLSPP